MVIVLYVGDGLMSEITDMAESLINQGYRLTSRSTRSGVPYLRAVK